MNKSFDDMLFDWMLAGYVFEASAEFSIPANGESINIFTSGDRPVILFSRVLSRDGVGVDAYIYRDPVFTGGIPVTWENDGYQNSNDINPKSGLVEITQLPVLTTPGNYGTLTRSPIRIFANTSNQGKGDYIDVIESPQLLLPNKSICLRLKNRETSSVQKIASHLRWVEPRTMPDLSIIDGVFKGYTGRVI
jgi:hypothetical protein